MTRMQQRRVIYTVLLIIFISIFTWSGIKVIKILNDSKSSKNNLIYTNKSNVNYNLEIDNNEFIKSSDLNSYEIYISSLVQNINMNMRYKYSGSEDIPIKYKYRVIATIHALYNQSTQESALNPKMWKKDYILVPYKEGEIKEKELQIEEKFKLDWKTYNQEVISFKESLSLPTTAYLEVKLEVDLKGNSEKYSLTDKQEVVAKMDLNEQVFSINAVKDHLEEKIVQSNDIKSLNREQRKLIAYIILSSLTFISSLITIKQIIDSKDSQPFHEEIEAIKKDYDEIIVETKNMISVKGLNQVTIASFDEMLDLADSIMLPIMLYEEPRKAIFYIIKNDMMYIYLKTNKKNK